jgi:hypothetical protein
MNKKKEYCDAVFPSYSLLKEFLSSKKRIR